MKAILNETIYSNFNINEKERLPYGKRGEEVTIIAEHLPALIVQNKKGERYPINIQRVTIKN